MKKIISLILSVVLVLGVTAQARVGDKIGMALNTDIVVYINNYAIPSYAVDGTSCIVAEDLRNFGFDVAWNGVNKTLSIRRNSATTVNPMSFSKTAKTGSFFADLLETDIVVFADGYRVSSYAMNGYTMIPVEELTMFGSVNWVESERALKMWVDGLHVRDTMQPIQKAQQTAPTYGGNTFNRLKNAIISQGTYSYEYKSYSVFESYDGANIMFSYDTEDKTIGMIFGSESDASEMTICVIAEDGYYPWLSVDYEGYSAYYEASGWFDGYGDRLKISETNFPYEVQSYVTDYINAGLSALDVYAMETFGISITGLGIQYDY